MRKLLSLIVCLTLGFTMLMAQNKTVTGRVLSSEDGEAIIGASVVVTGTTLGTITDANGNFSISVPKDAKSLSISYVGMVTVESLIKDKMSIMLEPNRQVLDDVVVTALGISKEKKTLGYAVQDIKAEALNQASQLNVANALQGKISGVQITQAGGAVGASQRIVIRGNSSFGSNDPLFVIDGVPMDGGASNAMEGADDGGLLDTGSGLNDINPEDIESISVLKGGSAALYGMRAGNGVILITTKKGKGGEKGKTRINYDGSVTFDHVFNLPNYQNKYGQGYAGSEYYWKAYMNAGYVPEGTSYQDYAIGNYEGAEDRGAGYCFVDGQGSGYNDGDDESWGPRLDAGLMIPQFNSNGQATPWVSHKNNIKDFFETGHSQSHNISIAHTGEAGNFRASLGYRDQEGTVPNTDQTRYNAQLSGDYNFSKYISADFMLSYNKVHSDNLIPTGYSSSNPLQSIMQWFGRQVDMKDLKANWNKVNPDGSNYNWIYAFHANPYYTVYNNTNSYDRDRVLGKGSIWVKPTSYLKFEGRMGYDLYHDEVFQKVLWNTDNPNGYFRDTQESRHELNLDLIGYFDKSFGDFNVTAIVGANYRDMQWKQNAEGAQSSFGLTVPGLYTMSNVAGSPYTAMDNSHIRSNSVYANASIGWKNQVFVEGSMRKDWSSTIKDAFFYPSVSLSWIPTTTFEALQSDVLSYLKIRGNFANVGNATSAYRTGKYFTSPGTTIGGNSQYQLPTTLSNPNLKPENINTAEVGLEAAFWKNRVRFDFAFYHKTTSDQIMTVEIPRSSGYSYQLINAGKVSNKGAEISLAVDVIKTRDFQWTSTLNWSKDVSRIEELTDGIETYTINSSWSCYNYAKVGEPWGVLYGTAYQRDEQGRILIGSNGKPMATASSEKIGEVSPDWLAGWQNEFSYKDFSLGFLLDYRKGGDFFSVSQMFGAYTGIYDYTAAGKIREEGLVVGRDVLKGAVLADGSENTKVISAQSYYGTYYSIKEADICDGSFLKLREAHLTYTLPKKYVAMTKVLSSAKLSLVGSNLAILWLSSRNQTKIDPECAAGNDNYSVGFESNSCPPTRSWGFKLNLAF